MNGTRKGLCTFLHESVIVIPKHLPQQKCYKQKPLKQLSTHSMGNTTISRKFLWFSRYLHKREEMH
jgi:hypothetical protein